MNPAPVPMPDYSKMAGEFDRFLPLIAPVGEAILDHLPPLPEGAEVLDVACGTGEPGLSLLRRSPGVRLYGVDQAEGMIRVARDKAARAGLGARFEVMSSEALAVGDGGADAVISRFGLLMFGDVVASARELARVLREGGAYSLAVWDEVEKNTVMVTAARVFRAYLPADHQGAMDRLGAWAGGGRREGVLRAAGLGEVESAWFEWDYDFAGFEDVWQMLGRMGGVTGQAGLSAEQVEEARGALLEALSAYRQPSGRYRIPHACRLIWGRR